MRQFPKRQKDTYALFLSFFSNKHLTPERLVKNFYLFWLFGVCERDLLYNSVYKYVSQVVLKPRTILLPQLLE